MERLRLDPHADFTTLEWLGNTGAVALPVTMALGIERGRVETSDNVAMLGIGSGINCVMLAVCWERSLLAEDDAEAGHDRIRESELSLEGVRE